MSILHFYILPIIGIFSTLVYLIFLYSILRLICTSAKRKRPYILPYTNKDLKSKPNGLVGPVIMVPLILVRPPSISSDILYEGVWENVITKKWRQPFIIHTYKLSPNFRTIICCKKMFVNCMQIKSFEIHKTFHEELKTCGIYKFSVYF